MIRPGVAFWTCLVGVLVDVLLMTVTSRIPAWAHTTPYFVLGALSFTVGLVANYLACKAVSPPGRSP